MKIINAIASNSIKLLVVTSLVMASFASQAAVDMFLKLDGIAGESRDAEHRDEIDVLAWSEGASSSSSIGGIGGAGKVDFQVLSVTKYIDSSSPFLRLNLAQGKRIPSAKLTVRKAGSTPLEYFIIDMEEVVITSISASGSGGEDRLTENVTFIFARIKWTYTPQLADGSADADISKGWNVELNQEF